MRRSLLISLVAACLAALLVCSCGREQPGSELQKTILIVDSAGREVEVPYPAERVAVHYPYLLEVIKALGAEEKVVAVPDSVAQGRWGKLFEEFSGKPGIGTGAGPGASLNLEALLEVNPDVLFAHPGTASKLGLEEKLKPVNIPLVEVNVTNLDTLERDIRILGKVLGKEKEAEEYLEFIEKYLKLVEERLSGIKPEEKPLVYLEFFSDYYTCRKGFSGDPVTRRAGGVNIGADLKVPKVSPEWVVEQNPDVIIKSQLPMIVPSGLGVTDPSAMENLRKELMSRPGWDRIKAVKEERVYVLNSDLWTSPRIWLGVLYTAKILYPERFRDINPDAVHREYLRRFLGLEGEGIWVWPSVQ